MPPPLTTPSYARPRRGISRTALGLAFGPLLLAVACGPGDPGGPAELRVEEVASPAGPGSGQPFLSTSVDAVVLTWQERDQDGGHAVRVARLGTDGWSATGTVARGADLFVNWADFPASASDARGRVWVHWLQRLRGDGLAYAVRLAHSDDGGASWSEAWTPHEDGTATEHGFVSLLPWGDGMGLTWLDGRNYAPGPGGEEPTREMTVRWRALGADGVWGSEVVLDERACDCCQTGAAVTDEGPVVVYRDRTVDEVRDVGVTRWTPEGWTPGVPVHDDGWVIAGCPVNGPAVDARGRAVVVAWFTGAGDEGKVRVAFSDDAGRTFAPPVQVDGGDPAGRVDALLQADGSAVVAWLERTGGDEAELRLARVTRDGSLRAGRVAGTQAARASGFPRMASVPWDPEAVLLAWTDVADADAPRVRLVRVELP